MPKRMQWMGLARILILVMVVAAVWPCQAYAIKQKPIREASGYPAAVLITARNADNHQVSRFCGVLIAPRAVLTVAHGVEGFQRWTVTAPYAPDGSRQSTSNTAKIHPDYRNGGKMESDLAVLVLDKKIDLGKKFPTLKGGPLLPLGTKLLLVGRAKNGEISQSQLFWASATLAAFPGNINVYGGLPALTEQGDSGGPVFISGKEDEIVAVISGGIGFNRGNVPTEYFSPIGKHHKSWILKQIPAER